MLTQKYKNFIEETSSKLINYYEKATNKKFDSRDINSIIDAIHFLNGDLIYVNDLYSKYKTDEMLLSQKDQGFLIIVDKEYIEKHFVDSEIDIKKICFRMIWMYIDEYLATNANIEPNKILYPKDFFINENDLFNLIKKNSIKQKKLILERN